MSDYYWRLRVKRYNPGQPRVPAGDPRGGQWTSTDHGIAKVAAQIGKHIGDSWAYEDMEPLSKEDQEMLASWMERHPTELFGEREDAAVQAVYVYTDHDIWKRTKEIYGVSESAIGFFDGSGIHIDASVNGLSRAKRYIFDHEVGHALIKKARERRYMMGAWVSYQRKYDSDWNFGRFTNYSGTSAEESFCDSYSIWLNWGAPKPGSSDWAKMPITRWDTMEAVSAVFDEAMGK